MFDQDLGDQDLNSFIAEEVPQQSPLILRLKLCDLDFMIELRLSQVSVRDLRAFDVLQNADRTSLPKLDLQLFDMLQEECQKWLRYRKVRLKSPFVHVLIVPCLLRQPIIVSLLVFDELTL